MTDQTKVVYDLSNDAIFNVLERPRFQGHIILWRQVSQKRYEIQT